MSEPPRLDYESIPGYEVWQGRTLAHARYRGTCAQAHREHRAWRVVGRDVPDLVLKIATGEIVPGRFTEG